jgi:predicted DCC family thiol-disulfide oxidoreductase YuxK
VVSALLIFDGDCAFCTSSVAFTRRWIKPPAEAVPWQQADLATLGLTEAACHEAVQYRDSSGRWHSAGSAVAAILIESRFPWSALGRLARLPALTWIAEGCYRWVAANRYRLPGGTPACQAEAPATVEHRG